MSEPTLARELHDGVLTLSLQRPQRLNAFTVQMADELQRAFQEAGDDDAVRAIVVTGSGRAFCAGMDLGSEGNVFGLDESLKPTLQDLEQRLDDEAIARGVRDTGGRVALAIYDCPKPVVAAVNGPAIGVGATMTLPMDIRIAAEGAAFGFAFNKIGIVPDACSSWFLPRVVGMAKALRWSYTGEMVSAAAALQAGLVEEVVTAGQLLQRAHEIARSLVHNRSMSSIALTRRMLWRHSAQPDPWHAHRIESLAIFHASQHDGKEGVAAFREKREPRFTGTTAQALALWRSWGQP